MCIYLILASVQLKMKKISKQNWLNKTKPVA